MNREQQIKDILTADVTLMNILTGGIYTSEEVGIEGFQRGAESPTAPAFDDQGNFLPCAAISEGDLNPFGQWRDLKEKLTPTSQQVFIYFYEFRGHSEIYAAKERVYNLLEGIRLPSSYELSWSFDTRVYADMGPVKNSSVLRQEWQIVSIRRPT